MQTHKFTSSKIEELKKRRKKILKIKIIILFVFIILIFVGLVFLSRWQKLNIETIQIEGNKVLDKEDLDKIIKNELNKKYIWLFPKSNVILLPKNKLKKELMSELGRIETLEFNLPNFNTLEVKITERVALYTWCGEELPPVELAKEKEDCRFVDNKGFVFDQAPYFSGNVYFKFYGKLENSVFEEQKFHQYSNLIEDIELLDLIPIALYEKEDGETEIYLSLNTPIKIAPKIIFNQNEDLNKLYENLEIAVKTDPLKTELKDKYSKLLYIDLRFNNKVFYKFSE